MKEGMTLDDLRINFTEKKDSGPELEIESEMEVEKNMQIPEKKSIDQESGKEYFAELWGKFNLAINSIQIPDEERSKLKEEFISKAEGEPEEVIKAVMGELLLRATKRAKELKTENQLEPNVPKNESGENIPKNEQEKNCPQCGAIIKSNNKFCGNCGNDLKSVCSKCGASTRLGANFCGECGGKI